MRYTRSTFVRGAIAGMIGAATLAVFFLVLDAIAGRPFNTPAFLAGITAGRATVELSAPLIAMYTLVHFALFITVGVSATWVIERARIRPHILLGAVLGFLLFDILFYASVLITGVNVVRALGWPGVLAGNVLAGMAMFAWLQAAAPADAEARAAWSGSIVREGLVAGSIGAVTVALWFLVLDIAQGRIFFTPAALGSALFLQAGSVDAVNLSPGIIAGYTMVHFASFILVGLLAAAIFKRADRGPPVLLGAVLLFVTLEAFFIGLIAIVASWMLDIIPWWTIAIANLVAGVAMGIHLWRAHPRLREELARESLEEPSRSEAA
jgi:hypothetical protein